MKVCKFGGTSVGTVERMKHVATLIKDATPKIVVLSATAGTTNHLEEIAANLFNREIEQAHDRITRLEFQFIEFANGLLTDEKLKREAIDYILDRFQQLWKYVLCISCFGTVTFPPDDECTSDFPESDL